MSETRDPSQAVDNVIGEIAEQHGRAHERWRLPSFRIWPSACRSCLPR